MNEEITPDKERMANGGVISTVLRFGLLQKTQGSDSAPLFSFIHTLPSKYYSFSIKCQLGMLV